MRALLRRLDARSRALFIAITLVVVVDAATLESGAGTEIPTIAFQDRLDIREIARSSTPHWMDVYVLHADLLAGSTLVVHRPTRLRAELFVAFSGVQDLDITRDPPPLLDIVALRRFVSAEGVAHFGPYVIAIPTPTERVLVFEQDGVTYFVAGVLVGGG